MIGTITIPSQDLASPDALELATRVETLEAFSPIVTSSLRPLGRMNRARIEAYARSADHRGGRSGNRSWDRSFAGVTVETVAECVCAACTQFGLRRLYRPGDQLRGVRSWHRCAPGAPTMPEAADRRTNGLRWPPNVHGAHRRLRMPKSGRLRRRPRRGARGAGNVSVPGRVVRCSARRAGNGVGAGSQDFGLKLL